MTEKEFITGLLTATLQRPDGEIASLFKEDGTPQDNALQTVQSWYSERFKSANKFDDGHKKGFSEAAKQFESKLKSAVGLETDLKGDELFSELTAHIEKKKNVSPAEMTTEQIKAHPAFIERERQLLKQITETEAKLKAENEKILKDVSRKETLSKIEQKALAELFDKISLPENKEAAQKQFKRLMIDPIHEYDYQIDGELIFVMKDGKRIEDDYGNPVTLEKHFAKIAADNGVVFKQHKEKQSPNGNGQNEFGKVGDAITLPRTEQEYAAIISNNAIPIERRMEIKNAWNAQKAQA